jgi:dolichyl-phosphate-mannose-protein mannosyltransferase
VTTPLRRRLVAALVLVSALALALRAARIDEQPLIQDDLAVGATARQFTRDGLPEPTMWNHPRLRDILVASSLAAVGESSWGLKAWSVLLGTLSVPATALLVLAVGGGAPAAVVAALLVALDPLHLDFSRQAINDVYLAFFPVAALAATWRYRATRRTGWLVMAGTLFGLGLATKWSVAFLLVAAAAVVVVDALRAPRTRRERLAELAFAGAALGALPLALYLVTFLPWFGRGYSLAEWLRFQGAMAFETATHRGYAGTKRPGYAGEIVRAWTWFLRPIYYTDIGLTGPGEPARFLVGIGNPVAWLAVWPAAALAAWRAVFRRDRAALVLLALFATAYGPFLLARRPIWTNSAVAVVPFSMALVAWAAAHLAGQWRAAAGAFLAAAVVSAGVLAFPAVGIATRASDPIVHAIVPPIAFLPKRPEEVQRPP